MTYTLIRTEFRPDGIFSELYDDNSVLIAHTVEHSYNSLPKIPNGTFICVRGTHQLHSGPPFSTFEITGIPGHTGVLFHQGNWGQTDSDGCCLLGEDIAPSDQGQMVTNSKATFQKFIDALDGINEFDLVVS